MRDKKIRGPWARADRFRPNFAVLTQLDTCRLANKIC